VFGCETKSRFGSESGFFFFYKGDADYMRQRDAFGQRADE
jgi:hypothetical protein